MYIPINVHVCYTENIYILCRREKPPQNNKIKFMSAYNVHSVFIHSRITTYLDEKKTIEHTLTQTIL